MNKSQFCNLLVLNLFKSLSILWFKSWSMIIVIYTISGIKAILQDSSVKIADDEGVSPSSSVITRVCCNML
jgi:GTP-dependent phosphoenolpyruvate carboxykinase